MNIKISTPHQRRSAFTMIEIAISLGIIAFALVAIIGILPIGLNVQKETNQDTIISQDGPFFLEAIRNGAPFTVVTNTTGLDFLTNYIEEIWTNTGIYGLSSNTVPFTSGQQIIGLLSATEFFPGGNTTTARVRALSGSALEQSGGNTLVAFRYYMTVEIYPFNSFSTDSTNFLAYVGDPVNYAIRYNRFEEVQPLRNNLYEVRLKFTWPVLPNGSVGPGRQTYRCVVSGSLIENQGGYFFQPNSYANP